MLQAILDRVADAEVTNDCGSRILDVAGFGPRMPDSADRGDAIDASVQLHPQSATIRNDAVVRRKPALDFSLTGLVYCAMMMFMGLAAINSQANLLFGVFGLMIGILLVSGVISRIGAAPARRAARAAGPRGRRPADDDHVRVAEPQAVLAEPVGDRSAELDGAEGSPASRRRTCCTPRRG